MSTSKNKFSVKAAIFPNLREKAVDGPWKPTVEEAVTAFAAMLEKRGWAAQRVYRPFVAERCEEAVAPSKDGRGNYYKSAGTTNPELRKLLEKTPVVLSLHF